jgi:hypothetical protein
LESSLEKKKIEVSKDDFITSFAYDKANKTLFISYYSLPINSEDFMTKIKAVRFNGNINTPFEKDIYSTSLTKEEMLSKYTDETHTSLAWGVEDMSPSQKAKSYITSIQLGKNPNSLLISVDNSFYLTGIVSPRYFVLNEAKELSFNISE